MRYAAVKGGSQQNKLVSANTGTTIISELTKGTAYTVEVAAETTAGTGVYSHPLTILIPGSEFVVVDLH